MFRNIKTTNERRQYDDWDGMVRIRPARNIRNIPNSYDDIHRSCYRDTCWKRYRRTQYRTKPNKLSKDSTTYAKHMGRRVSGEKVTHRYYWPRLTKRQWAELREIRSAERWEQECERRRIERMQMVRHAFWFKHRVDVIRRHHNK